MTGCLHGEYGCDGVQGGNDDANLTNASCQQQGPGGFPVSFAMPKHLWYHGKINKHKICISCPRDRCVFECVRLTLRNGMMPSREMAWRRRGAPVRLWSPAPHVEKKEPKTITHGDGHARVPITRLPLTPSPNLWGQAEPTQGTFIYTIQWIGQEI